MTCDEALTLKPGDLVYLSGRTMKTYAGMVLEVVKIYNRTRTYGDKDDKIYTDPFPTIVLKQPGYDLGWQIEVQYQMISRFEG